MANKVLLELPSVLTVSIPELKPVFILYHSALVLNIPQSVGNGVLVLDPFVLVNRRGVPGLRQIPHVPTGGEASPPEPHGLKTSTCTLTFSSLSGSTTTS